MTDIKSQAEKDKSLTAAVIKRSDIFGESAGGAGLDDQKVKEVRLLSLSHHFVLLSSLNTIECL
jgi:hypothetical protein